MFLVEDLQNMRMLMTELFASIGGMHLVGTASTEAEAKLALGDRASEWDLVIVDLVLDQGSGMEVVRFSKKQWPEKTVAVFSGYATPGIREHCLALGADVVFDKAQADAFVAWLVEHTAGA